MIVVIPQMWLKTIIVEHCKLMSTDLKFQKIQIHRSEQYCEKIKMKQ